MGLKQFTFVVVNKTGVPLVRSDFFPGTWSVTETSTQESNTKMFYCNPSQESSIDRLYLEFNGTANGQDGIVRIGLRKGDAELSASGPFKVEGGVQWDDEKTKTKGGLIATISLL